MEETKEIELSFPGYKETIQEIGRQLSLRKGILLKRILFLIWPPLISAISLVLINEAYQSGWLQTGWKHTNLLLGVAGFWLVFSLCYYYFFSFIFDIEKIIWVDSFFDKRNLDPKDSWRIAKKLFWPYFRLRLVIFVRYILPAAVLFYVYLFQVLLRFAGNSIVNDDYLALGSIVASLIIGMYFYYLRVILRYVPFIFLDRHGTDNVFYSELFKEMKELKKIESTKTHTRALLAHLFSDVVNELVSANLVRTQRRLSYLGLPGKIAGVSVRMFGEETSRQVTSVGRSIAVYLLYRFVRQKVYGQAQYINESLYKL